jgi:hypothetical protein
VLPVDAICRANPNPAQLVSVEQTGRKGGEAAEGVSEYQERTKQSTRGTRGEKGQRAVRTDPDRQLVNQPWAAEQERSADEMEEGGTDQVSIPIRVRKQRFSLFKSVLLMACLWRMFMACLA